MAKKKSLEWLDCSESELGLRIQEIAGDLVPGTLVFLEGEMGAGKSSFVRAVLSVIAPSIRSQGSPTFPLVTEYRAEQGFPIYHIDVYRLRNEAELEDSGIEAQIEEPGALVLIEWASLFDGFFEFYRDQAERIQKKAIRVNISGNETGARNYRVTF